MAKSALTTSTIRSLKKAGLSINEIARRAGTTPQAIGRRLSPHYPRIYGRIRYRYLNGSDREKYIAVQKRQSRENQKKSLRTRIKQGEKWTQREIDYLKLFGKEKTVLELAMDLGRSWHAVMKAAQRYGIKLRHP